MGNRTLAEFREDLAFDLLGRDDLTDDWLDRRINDTYTHVCHPGVFPHVEMQTNHDILMAQDQETYTMNFSTTGFWVVGIRSVFHLDSAAPTALTEKTKLAPRDIRWFDKRTLSSGQRPRSWAFNAFSLHVEPMADATAVGTTIRVRCWRAPALLTLAGSATTIVPQFDEIIQLGARWRAERDLGYRDKAELTKQDYAALLNEYVERQDLEAQDWGWEIEVNHGDSVMEIS